MTAGTVTVRCGVAGCNRLLLTLTPPDAWEGKARIPACPRHGGIRGHIFDAARRRHAKGLDPRPEVIVWFVPWDELRHKFYESATRGKAVDHFVAP